MTTQVVSPGSRCPSNDLFAATGLDYLYATSANLSRHVTGAAEEPAHWSAAGIVADFGEVPGFTVVAHRDEAAARASHPRHLPMSTTLVSFHRGAGLVVERHGSPHLDDVRRIVSPFGLKVFLGDSGKGRLPQRDYPNR